MPVHRFVKRRFISGDQGWGLIAVNDIPAGTVVIEDRGYKLTVEDYFRLPLWARILSFSIDEVHFLAPMHPAHVVPYEAVDNCFLSNHSCDPNTERSKENFFSWIARRTILSGEQITADYATLQVGGVDRHVKSHEPFDFNCECGALHCRERITDRDWCLPQFRGAEYDGQFPPYIDVARIAFRMKRAERHAVRKFRPRLVTTS